jgi:hypothetical protein
LFNQVSWNYWIALGYGRAALKEEMQVGLNAIYKGFNDVQSVTLEKAMEIMSLLVFKVKKH